MSAHLDMRRREPRAPGEHVPPRVASRARPPAAAGVWPDGFELDAQRALQAVRLVLVVLAGLLVLLYGSIAAGTIADCWNDENYSHGVLVPVVVLVLLQQRRRDLVVLSPRMARRIGALAWALVAAGAGAYVLGSAAAESFTQRMSGVLVVAGLAGVLGGPKRLVRYGPPLALLACAVPLPYVIYYKISFPMQLLSAQLAAGALHLMGFDVTRSGNIFEVGGHALEVIGACSGIRSMMALETLALAAAVALRLGAARGATLGLVALPAALAGNLLRLVVTALLVLWIGTRATEGALHAGVGVVSFLGSVALLAAAIRLLRRSAAPAGGRHPRLALRAPSRGQLRAWLGGVRVISTRAAWVAVLVLTVPGAYGMWLRAQAPEPGAMPRLETLPLQFGGLSGRDVPLDDRILDALQPESYVFRSYEQGDEPPIGLYVAYYRDPRQGAQIHSPLHCYPGAGWRIEESAPLAVRDLRGQPTRMQRLLVRKGDRQDVVVYWYDTRTGRMASDIDLKLNLVRTALLRRPRDAAFVRWSTPIAEGEDVSAATVRLLSAVADAYPDLEAALPFGG